MNKGNRSLRLAIIAGEESGAELGADLVRSIRKLTEDPVELSGVGGGPLEQEGMESLFDPSIIAIMGLSAVLKDMPRLVWLIDKTARQIAAAQPDCVVLIDSPAFNLRVARKIRSLNPRIPIIKYVCPSVWAWLPRRAPRMQPYIDHVMCLLPFEPDTLKALSGPPGTYVGHRLSHSSGLASARVLQETRANQNHGRKTLLILPGSRRSEVRSLIGPFFAAANLLVERGHDLRIVVPTLPRLEKIISDAAATLRITPEIITGDRSKWQAMGEADVALAASGTVVLELALAGVPVVSCYKPDLLWKLAIPLITTWSASLPNLIADSPIVPEYFGRMVRPNTLARHMEALWSDGSARKAQLDGFAKVQNKLHTLKPAGVAAAEIVLEYARNRVL